MEMREGCIMNDRNGKLLANEWSKCMCKADRAPTGVVCATQTTVCPCRGLFVDYVLSDGIP